MKIPDKENEYIENSSTTISIDSHAIEKLKSLALKNSRKRIRQNLHAHMEDSVHEMIIVQCKDSYNRPHKHSKKSESFHLIEGELTILIFDDKGEVKESIPMSASDTNKPFCYRLGEGIWHTLLAETEFIVFHETTSGPFIPNNAELAPWAPDEFEENFKSYKEELDKYKNKKITYSK